MDIIKQADAVKESKKRFVENATRPWGLYGLDIGIHPLNMAIGGWVPSKLTVIAGRSGHGKTALTPQMFAAGRRIQNKRKAEYLFCSWETDASYMVDRHVCREMGMTLKQLTQGAKLIGEESLKRINNAYDDGLTLPVSYQTNSTSIDVVSELFRTFAEYCYQKGKKEDIEIVPVLVVDYIGLAKFQRNDIRSYDVADFVNGVKKLVNELNGAACLLAQIKRSSDDKLMPDRNDISDSQSIEQAADNMIILYRPEYNNVASIIDPETGLEIDSSNKMLFRVLKARDYGIGDRLVACDIKHFRFHDMTHPWDYDYTELYKNPKFWIQELGLGS